MQDLLRSRRGLVVSAAVVILCIIGFFLATVSNWRPFLNNARQPVASEPSPATPQPGDTVAQQAAATAPAAPKPATGSDNAPQTAVATGGPAGPSAPPAASATPTKPPAGTPAPVDASTAGPSDKQPDAGKPPAGAAAPAAPAAPSATSSPSANAQAVTTPPATGAAPPTAAPSPTAEATAAAHPADDAGSPAAKPANDRVPSFDILRVEPTGDSVIAARGAPNAEIDLLDGGTAIAHATADASGQVAFLPPPLKPGEHSLMLSMTSPGGARVVSSQSVAVSIPVQPKTAPMVALIQPNQPAAILSGPVAGSEAVSPPAAPAPGASAPPNGPAKAAQPAEPVAIRSVEVESMGSFYAAGRAPPGSKSRIYLNDAYVATVTAGANGNWSLRINRGMKPGHYEVRADQVERDGRVAARAQVPFDYPTQVASASAGLEAAKKKSEAPTIVTAPSPAGSTAAPDVAQAGPDGAAAAGPGGGAAAGAAATQVGGAAASPPRTAGGMGGGNAAAGAAVAPLGAADGAGAETQAGAAAGSAGLPAAGEQPLPPVNGPTPPTSAAGGSAQGSVATASDAAQPHKAVPSPAGSGAASNPSQASSNEATPAARRDGHTATDRTGAAGSASAPGAGGVNGGNDAAGPAAIPAQQDNAPPSGDTTQHTASTAGEPAVPRPEPRPPGSDTAQPPNASPGGGAETKPQAAAGASSGAGSASAEADESPTVVEELVTAKVVHGDSLWRISRHMLGHGIRYTQIYAANTQQIRDPRLIYPGQVFVMPQD